MKLIVGVSLKMYFGYQQTVDWCRQIASLLEAYRGSDYHSHIEMFTFPSAPVIRDALQLFAGTPMAVGAQNISLAAPGAWTGEISAAMIKEMGCQYVEIGHAERRRYFHETDQIIVGKTRIALQNGLTPVICIGESQRMSAHKAIQTATEQAYSVLTALDEHLIDDMIFAWEPQWAIGAQQPAADDYVGEVCEGLRRALVGEPHGNHRVIYGGSAGSGLLSRLYPYVDGIFLGRFAHQPHAFQAILDEVANMVSSK